MQCKNDNLDCSLKYLMLARIHGLRKEIIADYIKSSENLDSALDRIKDVVNCKKKSGLAKNVTFPERAVVEAELEMTIKYGAKIIGVAMPEYPWLLKEIFNPPIALTVSGNIEILNKTMFSIIGARKASIVGMQLAYEISNELSNMGLTIVSGLASGIDTASHKGAINNTVAVVGTGINKTYPDANKELSQRIIDSGGIVVSEFAFNANATPGSFPQRNRIIAGMSYGVLVVEAGKRSGSLITAHYAIDYNREVYAIPGFPSDLRYSGNNELIKNNTAKMVENASDIYNDLKDRIQDNDKVREDSDFIYEQFSFPSQKDINLVKDSIFNALSNTPVSFDSIASALSLNVNIVRIALLELEIEELVARTSNGNFFAITARCEKSKQLL